MDAYDIANLPYYWREEEPSKPRYIGEAIEFVQKSDDPDICGLVEIMANELQQHRLNEGEFLGNNSTDLEQCRRDARFLLARVLLDRSSSGRISTQFYLPSQLENLAYSIWDKGGDLNQDENWILAERKYVNEGLEILKNLLSAYQAQIKH